MTSHVATVAGQPIPVGALEERMARIREGPRGRHLPPAGTPGYEESCRWIVRELVTEAVITHEMHARGMRDVTELVMDVTADVDLAEADIRAYYHRNEDRYRGNGSVIPYANARTSIEAELLPAARVRAFDLWLEGRRRELAIVEPGYEHPADPRSGFPSHRH